jgi:hypothetical protein
MLFLHFALHYFEETWTCFVSRLGDDLSGFLAGASVIAVFKGLGLRSNSAGGEGTDCATSKGLRRSL